MSLTRKLILFSMLLVTGTGVLVLGICSSQSRERVERHHLGACKTQAGQLAESLGADLVQDHLAPELAKSRERVLELLQRLVRQTTGQLAIYSLTYQDNRAIVVQEARLDGEPRNYGTPVPLSHTGHRALRTHAVLAEVVDRDGLRVVQAFAPIHDTERQVLGLLVTESVLQHPAPADTGAWLPVGVAAAAGLLAIAILLISTVRPLERLQEQLVAKQGIAREHVRTPTDLLREITNIIDKSNADRDFFEARLKQKERQSESTIRRKDEAISNTVHELRTPLTAIVASLEIMIDNQDQMTQEETRDFMAQASTAARHMMFVVNDMLDAAAIEAGQIHVDIEPCNLDEMLTDARRSMEIIAAARAMTLEVAFVDPRIEVMADPSRLMQVLFNLVSNAVKYTPSGTTITMRAWPSLKSVIIEVEDQGHSIPIDMRDKLFTRFSKFESDTSRVDSTGIGLYLSKKLVELMHGTIGYRAVESGDGSVFWFTLPLATEGSKVPALES